MRKEIKLKGKLVAYTAKKHRWAKNIKLAIYPNKGLVATIPYYAPYKIAEAFIVKKADWVLERLGEVKKYNVHADCNNYKIYKEKAKNLALERLEHFNKLYNYKFFRVSIRNQQTRWGSCSKKGNLNFNYKIALISQDLCDYIIVHELCHLKELNHSQKFWDLVAQTIPNYKERRKRLKKYKL